MPSKILVQNKMGKVISEKSNEISCEHRKKGNEHFKGKELEKAVEAYSRAVQFAPIGTHSLATAFGNRSAALIELNQIQSALNDTRRALDALASSSATDEAAGASKLPQTDSQKKLVDKLVARKEKIEQNHDSSERPLTEQGKKKSSEDSLKLCKKVKVDYNSNKGRFLTAEEDIKRGDVIFEELPFASVSLAYTSTVLCHYCYHSLPLDFLPLAIEVEFAIYEVKVFAYNWNELRIGVPDFI